MPDYVFLSFAPADRSYVESLARQLTAERIPWWTGWELNSDPAGEQMAGAAVVLVVVSPRALADPHLQGELRTADELGRPIVALVRRPAELSFRVVASQDVTAGGLPPPEFLDRLRALTGAPPVELPPETEVRLPHRLGPLPKTAAETWSVRALLAAAVFLAVAGAFSGSWNLFLLFPAFGIPDVLFAWFRWRRFRLAGRWATDLRTSILLTGLTVYLAVVYATRITDSDNPFLLIGLAASIVLGALSAAIWMVQAIKDRP